MTHSGHSTDGDWIAVERPRIPPRPQPPIALWGWLIDDREPTSEPELRELEEGEEFPDSVVAAYDDYLDAWRDWIAKYGPRSRSSRCMSVSSGSSSRPTSSASDTRRWWLLG